MRFGKVPFCVPVAGRKYRVILCSETFRDSGGRLRRTMVDCDGGIIWLSDSVFGHGLAAELALAVAYAWEQAVGKGCSEGGQAKEEQ